MEVYHKSLLKFAENTLRESYPYGYTKSIKLTDDDKHELRIGLIPQIFGLKIRLPSILVAKFDSDAEEQTYAKRILKAKEFIR